MDPLYRLVSRSALPPAAFARFLEDTLDDIAWFRAWLIHGPRGLADSTARKLASTIRQGLAAESLDEWANEPSDAKLRAERNYARRLWDTWQAERGGAE